MFNWYKYSQTQEELKHEKSHYSPFEIHMMDKMGIDPGDLDYYKEYLPEQEAIALVRGSSLDDMYHQVEYIEDKQNQIWYWNGSQIYSAKGGTHGSNFGHINIHGKYKGRYNPKTQIITVATPGHSTSIKAIPEEEWLQQDPQAESLINALHKKFPKAQQIVAIV